MNHHSRHAVPAVSDTVTQRSAADRPVIFTRCINRPGSSYECLLQWHRLKKPPETDIVPALTRTAVHAHAVIDETGTRSSPPRRTKLIRRAGRTYLVFCGIATESCVLKSAADAFEHVYAPWIVADALASGVGPDIHDAGLVVACGLIGTGQLVTAENVVGQLTACAGAPVLE